MDLSLLATSADQLWDLGFSADETTDIFHNALEITNIEYVFDASSESKLDALSQVEMLSCELDDIPIEVGEFDSESGNIRNKEESAFAAPVYHISPGVLEGSHFSAFLATFVVRTRKFGVHLIKAELIQKYLSLLPSGGNSGPLTSVEEKATRAYILAAVGIGSLQANYFCPESHERHYQTMKNSFKGCFMEESEHVVFAHILVSLFCRHTGRINDCNRHTGFARTLLSLPGMKVSEYVKQSYAQVILGPGVTTARINGNEALGFQLLYARASIPQKEFALKFPSLSYYLLEKQKVLYADTNLGYKQELSGINEFLESTDIHTLIQGMMMTTLIGGIVTNSKLLKSQKVNTLSEFLNCLNLLGSVSGSPPANKSLTMVAMVCLTEMFCSFFSQNFQDVKVKLKYLVRTLDSYVFCSWIMFEAKHLFHLIAIVMACLELHTEYAIFQKKINPVLALVKQPQFPESLPPIGHAVLQSICPESCCSSHFVFLP